ncbi:hypothetical protein SUGI_0794660 [Cryptomeria japonica]|nr:hypothetical protein SUGI_0794660 [Cryptomeria japonica]
MSDSLESDLPSVVTALHLSVWKTFSLPDPIMLNRQEPTNGSPLFTQGQPEYDGSQRNFCTLSASYGETTEFLRWGVDIKNGYPTTGKLSPALFKLKYLEHLDLSANFLSGVIPAELSSLHRLKHLDLSFNYFEDHILKHISSLHSLIYLNLSCAGVDLDGSIQWRLGNISQLQVIDLSSGLYIQDESSFSSYYCGPVYSSSLEWTEIVQGLQHLSLQGVELNMTGEQLESPLSRLHNLRHLNLKDCALSGHVPNALQNLSHLSHLQLGWNQFTSRLPTWLGNMTDLVSIQFDRCDLTGPFPSSLSRLPKLKELNLVDNKLTGNIRQILPCEAWPQLSRFSLSDSIVTGSLPPCIGNLSALQYLDLQVNSLSGQIPASVGMLSALIYLRLSSNLLSGNVPPELGGIPSLEVLYLDNNQLYGSIPTSLRCLTRLSSLNLAKNNLEGYISLHFFENATRLVELVLSCNKLTVLIEPEWIPPMQFERLGLGSCNIGGLIPAFLSTQFRLEILDLSNNSLFGNIPAWFGDLSTLADLYMSHNNLQGELPSTFDISYYSQIYLDDNMLTGSVPVPSVPASYLGVLDLSQNRYTGFIPVEIGSFLPAIEFLLYSQNDLRGDIPTSIGLMQDLQDLDLSDNNFEGKIPPILTNCSALKRLNLAKNKLSGEIPSNIGSLRQLEKLHLSDNMLKGNLPFGVQNCSKLQILDVAHNFLSVNIPLWLGQLSDLMILVLRSNKFHGRIPHALGNLSSLHVLDISHNNLTGAIPPELGRFAAIIAGQPGESNVLNGRSSYGRSYYYKEEINVTNKGLNLDYRDSVLLLITAIDLSSNQLSGMPPVSQDEEEEEEEEIPWYWEAPTWIRLTNLPPKYCNLESLRVIWEALGSFISVDEDFIEGKDGVSKAISVETYLEDESKEAYGKVDSSRTGDRAKRTLVELGESSRILMLELVCDPLGLSNSNHFHHGAVLTILHKDLLSEQWLTKNTLEKG